MVYVVSNQACIIIIIFLIVENKPVIPGCTKSVI